MRLKRKRILSILLTVLVLATMLCVGSMTVFAAETTTLAVGDTFDNTSGGIQYKFKVLTLAEGDTKGTVEIVGFGDNQTDQSTVKFDASPSILGSDGQSYTITGIAVGAFRENHNIQTVDFAWAQFSSIGMGAFSSCFNLQTVTLTNSKIKSVGYGAFTGSGLTTVNWNFSYASSVTLEDAVFMSCTKLTTVTLPNSLTTIPMNTFFAAGALSQITIPASVTRIDGGAFEGTQLVNVEIPAKVNYIGGLAFASVDELQSVVFKSGEAPTFETNSFPSHVHQLTVVDGYGDGMYAAGQTVTPTCNGDSQYFKGWKVTSGNATVSEDGMTITTGSEASTIEPVYSNFGVFFDANGGDGAMQSGVVSWGSEYTLPECTFIPPDGMQFKAWEINGEEKSVGDIITVTANVNVTALWESKTMYTVTFDPNGGTGTMDSVDVPAGTTWYLPECTFTPPEGYTFFKWDVDGILGSAGKSAIRVNKNTKLKAVWALADVVSVDISWGAMEFTYTDGEWNPETHSYEEGKWTAEGNFVNVYSYGIDPVYVDVEYSPKPGYVFDYSWNYTQDELTAYERAYFELTLSGKPEDYFEQTVIGIVTIKIYT